MILNTDREKINVITGKTLKLTYPIIKKLNKEEMINLNQALNVMQGAIKARGLKNVGPLITYNTQIIEDGLLMPEVSVITQVEQPPHNKLSDSYEFIDKLRITNCIYTRFKGEERHMQIAIMKMHVFAYENKIELKNGYYTIYLSSDETGICVDIFMETINE